MNLSPSKNNKQPSSPAFAARRFAFYLVGAALLMHLLLDPAFAGIIFP